MSGDCCNLVGNLSVSGSDIISINVKSSTEVFKLDNQVVIGATVGSIGVTKYADVAVHTGCVGKAGVQIPWIRKYDCENDIVYFIFAGAGRSYITGDIGNRAELLEEAVSYNVIQASASSGPSSLYHNDLQTDGYGLTYLDKSTNAWSFTTTDEGSCSFANFGIGMGPLYLQSFSLDCTPGQLPVATYDLVFTSTNGGR